MNPGNVSVLLDPFAFGGDGGNFDPSVRSRATYHRQKFPVSSDPPVVTLISTAAVAARYQAAAEAALRARQYAEASRWLDHALVEDPENGALRLFQVHALTGQKLYAAAESALRLAVLSFEQGGLDLVVRRRDEFFAPREYDRLVKELRSVPPVQHDQTRLLLAYHLMYLGGPSTEDARQLLSKLENDAVANLLQQTAPRDLTDELPVETLPAPLGN